MNLIQLLYTSACAPELEAAERDQILCRARANNARLGITGLLVHVEGRFFQLLEGEVEVVDELFLRIAGDPRHLHVAEIARQPIAERRFAGWRMGYADGISARHRGGRPAVTRLQRSQDALQDAAWRRRTTRHDCVYR